MGSNTNWTPPQVPGGPPPEVPQVQQGGPDPTGFWGGVGDIFSSLGTSNQDILTLLNHWFGASPEQQLTQQILEKMGGATIGTGRGSIVDRARVTYAQAAAHAAMTDPAYRQQLVSAMGWNEKNPHVAAWVQNGGAQLPSDPMGTGVTAGGTPTTTTTPTAPAATATIGMPFDPSKWGGRASDPGFTYGAVLPPGIAAAAGVANQWGVDYALPEGTALPSPWAGTVIEADNKGPYGNTVVVKLSNNFTYRVAHLASLGVVNGQAVKVGDNLGPVGNTGNSFGAHVLIEMRDATGKPIDPTPIIDGLLKGDTAGATKILGDYGTATANAPGPILTNDGHLLYPGSQDYDVFFAAQTLWRKRYGGDPPWSFVSSLIAAGNTTAGQIAGQMDVMSSDISGMNWGQRDAFSTSVSNAALKAWNRPVPDSTLKTLAAQGITDPGGIQGWINSHPASALDPGAYGQVFDAANPQHQQLWQQPPSPEMIKHIHDQMNQGPTTGA